jgi:hypothetical protein
MGLGVATFNNRQSDSSLDPYIASLLQDGRYPDLAEVDTATEALNGGFLKVSWPRTVAGLAEFSTIVGPIAIRAAGSYRSEAVVRRTWGQATTRAQWDTGIALDYVRGSTIQATLEARYSSIVAPPDDMMMTLPHNVQLAGGVRLSLLQSRLGIELGGAYDIGFTEGVLRPSVSWRVSDWMAVHSRGIFLFGSRDAPLTVEEALTWEGGMMGYFEENDAVSVGVDFFF